MSKSKAMLPFDRRRHPPPLAAGLGLRAWQHPFPLLAAAPCYEPCFLGGFMFPHGK